MRLRSASSLERFSDERGVTLVLLSISLLPLFGMLALVFDVGRYVIVKGELQNVADIASHAAAMEPSQAAANTVAAQLADLNRPPGVEDFAITVSFPAPSEVRVRASARVEFIFAPILGVNDGILTTVAATRLTMTGGPYALFANSTSCNGSAGLEISGSNNSVTGGSHGNGDVKVNGTQNTFNGGSTYRCNIDVGGQNNTFTPAAAQNAAVVPRPVSFIRANFPCTYSYSGNVQLSSKDELWLNDNPSTNQLKSAVICSTNSITLSSSNASGSVTLVARDIQISGSNANLSSHHSSGVLAFTDGSGPNTLHVSGSDATLSGLLYSRNGESRISGARVALTGGVYGEDVRISGSDVGITASGMGAAQRKLTIIE